MRTAKYDKGDCVIYKLPYTLINRSGVIEQVYVPKKDNDDIEYCVHGTWLLEKYILNHTQK